MTRKTPLLKILKVKTTHLKSNIRCFWNPNQHVATATFFIEMEDLQEKGGEMNTLHQKLPYQQKFFILWRVISRCSSWMITKKAVDFVLNKGKKFVEEDLTGRPVSEFNLMVLEQLNVTVHAIKIANLEFPEVNYEKLSRDTIKLSTCGGHLELRGLYRSVYQTIREGQFKAIVTGFETNLKIKITRTLDGKLKLQDKVCSSSIVRVEIELQPNLIDDVSEEIRIHLIDMLNTKICNYVGEYIDKIDQKLANMLKMSSIQLESKENKIQFDGKMLNDVMLEGEYFDLALAGEFLRSNKRAPFQPEIIVKHESDAEKMVYLYLSEYAINSFFYQIDSYAFFRINLHRIPEIESLLRLNCDASEDCLGRYFEWKNLFEPNSGRMEARPITCPSIEISEEGALLKLNLTVDIGYQKVGAKARTVIMGFNLLLEIMINSVDIKSVDAPKIMKRSISPSRLYQIQPQVSIKEMKVSSIKSYVEQIEDFSQDFDSYVYTRRELIEEMLNKNFHKIFSLPNKFPIEAQHISINFRRKTVMIGFDLKLDSTRSFFLHGKK
uniref:Lipid-binding serum glycoprotein C-terminal domain-containing protein n=1 Tax=Acrobeloides nanus TaxID=290746 RepID=A0A914CA58_9BILA